MSRCDCEWELYEDESVLCNQCKEVLDRPNKLSKALIATQIRVKELEATRTEKAGARVENLVTKLKEQELENKLSDNTDFKKLYLEVIKELAPTGGSVMDTVEEIKRHLLLEWIQVLGGEEFKIRIRNVEAERTAAKVKELEADNDKLKARVEKLENSLREATTCNWKDDLNIPKEVRERILGLVWDNDE